MRRFVYALAMMVLAWSVAGMTARAAWVDAPPAPVSSANDADPAVVMERGLDKERGRNWSGAMEVYRDALEHWPSRVEFGRRLRLCEIHFKLTRRYNDASFRNILLALPHAQAAELYDEVLDRIQSNYVDAVPFEPLVRHGLDNLEVALRDPVFLKANAPIAAPDRVTWLRETFRQYRASLAIADRAAAIRMAMGCTELGQRALGLAVTPVLLEFTCGACDALDDFTSYLTPDKLEDLYAMIDGNFVGLGIELKLDKDGLRLVGVIRGGPAWEAGLQPGDTIIKVDGMTLKGLGLDESANKLQGVEGSTIELVVRKKDGSLLAHRLVRRQVEVKSVTRAKVVDAAAGIGYLRLTGFQKTSADEIDAAIGGLVSQGMRVLVIDLRGNPGGLLNVAVDIAGRFVESGPIVSTRGRGPGADADLPGQRPAPVEAALVCPGRPRQRQRQRDPRRRAPGPPAGQDRRRPDLRQGLGPEHLLAAIGPGRPEADHGQVLLAAQSALQRAGRRARSAHRRPLVRQALRRKRPTARRGRLRRPGSRPGPRRGDPRRQGAPAVNRPALLRS